MALCNTRITHLKSYPLPRKTQKPIATCPTKLILQYHILCSGNKLLVSRLESVGYSLKCFDRNFREGEGGEGKGVITVGPRQFTIRNRRLNHSFKVSCSLTNVLQFPLCSLSLNCPDQVWVTFLVFLNKALTLFLFLLNSKIPLWTWRH